MALLAADAVTEICQRLDGIPLAIELAASRMVSMSVAEVRDRLDDRFRLLVDSRRGPQRHHTLRHVVQWSYDLLDSTEQDLLNRCSVFVGGFDLAGACAVQKRLPLMRAKFESPFEELLSGFVRLLHPVCPGEDCCL